MARQWQDMIYKGHRAESALSDATTSVKASGETGVYPDFITIAAGYGVRAERVARQSELPAAFERMLADPDEPFLLDVVVVFEENVYPMIPAGGIYRDIIMSADDLEHGGGAGKQGANVCRPSVADAARLSGKRDV
jgi:acetolactate synthase-1/2/3 large subunit